VPQDPVDVQKGRRQRLALLVVVNLLILGSGLVTAVDLRRLRTPGGTALRWVEAAVFGVCGDYLEFSVPDTDAPDQRSDEDLCRDLRASTDEARTQVASIGLRLGSVTEHGSAATAAVTLTRAGRDAQLQIHLVRRDGRWRVLRDAATCASVGCA
jgi:hypothetical protein